MEFWIFYIISLAVGWSIAWWVYDNDKLAAQVIMGISFIPLLNFAAPVIFAISGIIAVLGYPLVWLKEKKWKK